MNFLKQRRSAEEAGNPAPIKGAAERILQRVDWQIIRRLDGLLQGDYRSLFYGYGVDFADLREYQPEDDIRYIDWNVTARMDTPYVRQYVEDREVTAWFLIDLSPSMDFGSNSNDKRAVLIDMVATLSRLLTRHGNRVGAILFNGQSTALSKKKDQNQHPIHLIPAKGGRAQVLHLINTVLRQPKLSDAPLTDLRILLETALNSIKKRSLIFVLSDFISTPNWEKPLTLLRQRHELIAIRLWDPHEIELPDVGPLWLEDSETGEQMFVDTHDPSFRRKFSEVSMQRDDELVKTFRYCGVEPWSLSTGEDMVKAILRYISIRKQIHRTGTGALVRSGTMTTTQRIGN
jgi:uncharacterized protein (DUF58 family)